MELRVVKYREGSSVALQVGDPFLVLEYRGVPLLVLHSVGPVWMVYATKRETPTVRADLLVIGARTELDAHILAVSWLQFIPADIGAFLADEETASAVRLAANNRMR